MRAQVPVVLFMRRISQTIAGGARAVLQRANMLAAEGFDVVIVVDDMPSDAHLAHLRGTGQLHSAVRLLFWWRDGVPAAVTKAATWTSPLELPIRTTGPVEHERTSERTVARYRDADTGRLRAEHFTADGETTGLTEYDSAEAVTARWRFRGGMPVYIDRFNAAGAPVQRDFVAGGRLLWLSVDLTVSEGRGLVVRHLEHRDEPATAADATAEWLDRHFANAPELIVMADGENAAQHVLRAMEHPGVRGVSILHNSHKTAPYIGDAPTKENWVPFFEDLRNVHVMVCLTERQRSDLSARYPGLPLTVVHHAVPRPRRFRPARRHDRLVFVGRLAEQKRVEQLIEAFGIVAAAVPKARLDIYGSGALRESLEQQVESAGLGSRIRFQGHTSRPDKAFASAAAAVMSSRYEGLPLALTEAMAVGTPFIAYDLDYGPAEVIRDGVDGWLVPFGNVEALAARMIAVLQDRAMTARVSAAAREVGARFSAGRYRDEWLAVARAAAGRPAALQPDIDAPLERATH